MFLVGGLIEVSAQQVRYSSLYRVEYRNVDERPSLGGLPNITLSEKDLKKGIEGTFKVKMTLAKEGEVRNLTYEEETPQAVKNAISKAYQTFRFTPAKLNGNAVDAYFYLEYTVTMVYGERSKGVKKPKILEQPKALYPVKHLAEKRKDHVDVDVLFNKDGTLRVLRANSSMPREFDKAAVEAAKKIKFTPAFHKKTKKNITMQMTVRYKFKP